MRCIFFQIFRILVCSLFFITKVFAGEFHPMSSISLDGVDKGGHVIHAPSYCLAQNYNDVCAMGATFLNQHGFEQSYFYDSSSQNYKIYSESLQLFGTIGNGYTVDNLSAPSQTADYLMIVHLGDTPLNKHCGVVQSSDTRGCTYDEVNTLWSNLGEQIDEASAMAKYRRGYLTHSVSKGHVSINYYLDINYNLSNMALFLGTSKTVNQLGIKFNLNIEEAYTPTRFIRGYDSEDFSLNGINYSNIAGNYTSGRLDLFNYFNGSIFSFRALPSSTSQSSMMYLILKHIDLISGIPSYQLFILNTGHAPLAGSAR